MTVTNRIDYRIGIDDRIFHLGSGWEPFASDNGAVDLSAKNVVGRPIWDFIEGDEVRHLYRLLVDRVRAEGRPVQLPFRCDSPELRRYMELDIAPELGKSLWFSARLLRAEPRQKVAILDPSAPRSETFLKICSWCKRIVVRNDWLEIEDGIVRLGLFEEGPLPRLTHGMCPDCEIRCRQEWLKLAANH